ncbi:hypothetical protein [Brevundimonas sp.]|jgi:hypothetical protein|uniref:hypothetical protein n=1 Tax=Brevundimonas sp. TaxID=1871086 RepID=UPI0025BC99C1|nr:hypothetical protein [Brevundimonas sp.]
MSTRLSILMLSAAALVACSPKPAEAPAKAETPAPAAAPAEPAAPAAAPATSDVTPKAGESYWTVRARLVAAGFTPVDTNDEEFTVCPDAMQQQREISVRECPSTVEVLPEVNSCAGTGMGNCLTNWRSPDGRFLKIFTVDGPQPGVVQSIEWSNTRPAFEE